MSRRLPALLALAVVLSLPAYAKRRVVAPRPVLDSSYLTEAIAAAEWITSLERPTAGGRGLGWPAQPGANLSGTGVNSGAAGIGAYFLRLHRSTGDPRWLDKAERGAQTIMAEFRLGRFNTHEWLEGSAGAGHFLLELHAATRKAEYLDATHLAGNFILGNAIVDGDGVYWKHSPQHERTYTGVAHGSAGTAIFLVRLYGASGDSRYLDMAERTYRWLSRYTLPVESSVPAITWKRLITDDAGYNGWCGGSMGIVYLLDELHRATGKAEYLDAWRATIEGLHALAVRPTPEQALWTYYSTPYTTRTSRPVVYCHGTSANSTVVAEAAKRTGDARYAEAAAAAGRWLDSVAIAEAGGARWAHLAGSSYLESGLLTGTASVGHASLELYAATGDAAHLQRALRAAQWLLATADHPAVAQSRWLNRTEDGSGEPVEYRTGWYSGAAGIGIFLVELHDTLRGVPMETRFSPMSP
jgi:uncharacterized protein YyaL (SSP411 family)